MQLWTFGILQQKWIWKKIDSNSHKERIQKKLCCRVWNKNIFKFNAEADWLIRKERKKERTVFASFWWEFLCIKSNDGNIHQIILSVSWLNLWIIYETIIKWCLNKFLHYDILKWIYGICFVINERHPRAWNLQFHNFFT